MHQSVSKYRLKYQIVVASAAAIAVCAFFLVKSEKIVSEVPNTHEVGETFATHHEKITLSALTPPTINLGKLPMGAIREIKIETSGVNGGALNEVQSSCSCLQFDSLPPAGFHLDARYFAVSAGPVDVNVAFENVDASGKSNILTLRIVGEVMTGDAARSTHLTELVKTPRLSFGVADPKMLVSAKDAYLAVSSKRGLLIDVRSVEEYAREHAIESLNIPIAELRASVAFRNR